MNVDTFYTYLVKFEIGWFIELRHVHLFRMGEVVFKSVVNLAYLACVGLFKCAKGVFGTRPNHRTVRYLYPTFTLWYRNVSASSISWSVCLWWWKESSIAVECLAWFSWFSQCDDRRSDFKRSQTRSKIDGGSIHQTVFVFSSNGPLMELDGNYNNVLVLVDVMMF